MPIYMKFEGIVGPVKGKYAGWIELESCQLASGRGAAGGEHDKIRISDITISKRQDTSSTALFREALSGSGKKVTIDFVNAEGVAYMTIELENTLISSVSMSGNGGEGATESMSLNFTKIKYSTKPAGPASDANPRNTQAVWNSVSP